MTKAPGREPRGLRLRPPLTREHPIERPLATPCPQDLVVTTREDYNMGRSGAQGFAAIPRWLLYRDDVTIYAKMAYIVISSHANDDLKAWPSMRTIAAEGSMSRESAKRGVYALLDLGVIERTARPRRDGGRGSNIYQLARPSTGASGPVD